MARHLLTALILCCISTPLFSADNAKLEANKHYEQAVAAFAGENLSESFIHLKNALQVYPEHLSAKILLAKVFFNDGNLYAAEKEFEECLALGADINLILPLYGNTLILLKKSDKLLSLKKYSRSFSSDAKFEWQLLKGQAYSQQNNPALASKAFEKALVTHPDNVRALNTLAAHYFASGEANKAYDLIEKSIALSPDNEATYQLLGETALSEGNRDAALKYFTRAFELDNKDPKILRSMADIYLKQQNLLQAQKYLELIIEQTPGDPYATLLLAMVEISGGDESQGMQSIADLSEQLSLLEKSDKEGNRSALFVRATTEYIQGNYEKARTLLGNYLLNHPGDRLAIRMLTELYVENGNTRQALDLLQSHYKYIVGDFGLMIQLASMYIDEGKHFTARQELDKLRVMSPDHPFVLMLEADMLVAEGRADEALELLNSLKFQGTEPLVFLLKRGKLEINTGDLEKAARTAEDLLSKYPENIPALNYAAAVSLKAERVSSAKTFIEQALAISPENVTARYNQALVTKMEANPEAAVVLLRAILEDQPSHIPSILLVARIRFEEQNYDEALEWAQKISAYDKKNVAQNELIQEIYVKNQDWGNALRASRLLYKIGTDSPRYLTQQAEILIKTERYEEAQRSLYLLFGLWQKDPAQLLRLSRMQIDSGNLKGARQSLETAYSLDKSSYPVQLGLARLELLEGHKTALQAHLVVLQEEFGERSATEMFKGEIALKNNDLQLARKHFTKAFRLDKNNGQAIIMLYQLSTLNVGAEEFTRLIENHRKTNETAPWVTRLLADSYLRQGKTSQAQERYEELITTPGLQGNAEILNNLANIYAENNLDKALQTALKGLSDNPNYAALKDTVGWIYVQKGMYEDALSYLRDAYALDSSDPEIRYHQGVALAKLGRSDEAIRELRASVQSGVEFSGFVDAKQWIEKLEQ